MKYIVVGGVIIPQPDDDPEPIISNMGSTLDHECSICGHETEWFCQRCDEPVCENCTMGAREPLIEYTCCRTCGENPD